MDASMPDVDGVTATKLIRQFPENHPNFNIPVIAITAHALEEDRQRFIESGMTEVLTKPFSIKTITEAINQLFAS